MSTPVYMPILGMTMEEGTIAAWLKAEGDRVDEDELLLTVETDKAAMDVPSPASGVLLKILVPAGRTVAVRTPIAHIGQPGERVPDEAPPAPGSGTERPRERDAPAPTVTGPVAEPRTQRATSSPRARRAAAEQGVDLADVRGTGPGGRITEEDVLHAARERASARERAPEGVETRALSRVRRLTAERMGRSARTVARVTLFREVDLGEAARLREELQAAPNAAPVPWDALIVRAAGLALREHDLLRAEWIEGQGIAVRAAAHVGVAVALDPDGLVAPVIRDADRRGLEDLAADLVDKVDRARRGRLRPDELEGAVFTVTNLGAYGVESFTPIVDVPQAAILGVGRIAPRPMVRDGRVVARVGGMLSLSFDHRVLDGAPAAAFVRRLAELLEHPQELRGV